MRRDGGLLGRAVGVLAVLAVSAVVWLRLLGDDTVVVPAAAGSAVLGVLGIVAVGVGGARWRAASRAAAAHRAIAAERPGWTLHEVRAGSTLASELRLLGIGEPGMDPAGGTHLTLAWSVEGLELWRGARRPHLVVSLPWSQVRSVREGVASLSSASRPAVVVATVDEAELVVVPARRPAAARGTATAQATGALVGHLRVARKTGPPSDT